MSANLEAKKELVEEIKGQFQNCKSLIFVDYRGITVGEDTEMRKQFKKEKVSYKVYKNRLLLRALKELGYNDLDEKQFEGTTAVCFGEDEVAPARIFCDNSKKIKKMEVKFGILNGALLNKGQVEDLAKTPSKDVLIAMLLGQLQAPISAFARALDAISKKN